jgi:hypothetical protein
MVSTLVCSVSLIAPVCAHSLLLCLFVRADGIDRGSRERGQRRQKVAVVKICTVIWEVTKVIEFDIAFAQAACGVCLRAGRLDDRASQKEMEVSRHHNRVRSWTIWTDTERL